MTCLKIDPIYQDLTFVLWYLVELYDIPKDISGRVEVEKSVK